MTVSDDFSLWQCRFPYLSWVQKLPQRIEVKIPRPKADRKAKGTCKYKFVNTVPSVYKCDRSK